VVGLARNAESLAETESVEEDDDQGVSPDSADLTGQAELAELAEEAGQDDDGGAAE
jgi:hypothetical protein